MNRRDILRGLGSAMLPGGTAAFPFDDVVANHLLFAHRRIDDAEWTDFDLADTMATLNQQTFNLTSQVEEAVWRENVHGAENHYMEWMLDNVTVSHIFTQHQRGFTQLLLEVAPSGANAVVVSPTVLAMIGTERGAFVHSGDDTLTRFSGSALPVQGRINKKIVVFCHILAAPAQPTLIGYVPEDVSQRKAALIRKGDNLAVSLGIRHDCADGYVAVGLADGLAARPITGTPTRSPRKSN